MVTAQIEKVERLLRLFEHRISSFNDQTVEILQLLNDPIVRVVCDVLNVAEDHISWDSIDIVSPMIKIRCGVHYENEAEIPELVDIIAPVSEDPTNRTIVMAFPIIYAASSYEEFHEFISNTINKTVQKAKVITSDPTLSTEQQLQAYMHRPARKVLH